MTTRSRVAVVTGAGSGLGAALAGEFARSGCGVALADIDLANAEKVTEGLATTGARTRAYRVDVGSTESLEALAAAVAADFGACHVLCANVGVQQFGTIDSLREEDWRWIYDVNVHGSVGTVRAFLPLLRASEGQRSVLFTASTSAVYPARRLVAYTSTKYAILGIAETLRLELGEEGIGVSVMLPGPMATTHLQSSAAAKPDGLDTPVFVAEQIAVVSEDTAEDTADGADAMISPEYAARNVVADLAANEPYIVSHFVHAGRARTRFAEILDAFERAKTSETPRNEP
ncbi:MAG: SDR family oxidoreductase [Myxococcales bacterium]|nr:SDR family oxidoreductase [Myxococcales bacterium]